MSTRLETARLIIRTFEPGDAGPWLAMVTDPRVRRFLPAGPAPTMDLALRIIGERQAMERELGHTMWAVDDKTTGTFVGQCGLRPVEEGAGPEIDLAYHYTLDSWNNGYATEAAIAVLGCGLGPVGLAAIMAVVVPENIGSWRVMEKAGMRYQGLVDYYGMKGLKKYLAARDWWSPPPVRRADRPAHREITSAMLVHGQEDASHPHRPAWPRGSGMRRGPAQCSSRRVSFHSARAAPDRPIRRARHSVG